MSLEVYMDKNGLIVARARVGSRVFVSQGPTVEAQMAADPEITQTHCVGREVEKNVAFASMEDRGDILDDTRLRTRNTPEHARLRSPRHGR